MTTDQQNTQARTLAALVVAMLRRKVQGPLTAHERKRWETALGDAQKAYRNVCRRFPPRKPAARRAA
jgi:hypothetical protein